jgi:hypothetical protein
LVTKIQVALKILDIEQLDEGMLPRGSPEPLLVVHVRRAGWQ